MYTHLFLNKKQVEFSERIAQLKADQVTGTNAEIEEHKRAIETYRSELNQYALSEEVAAFGRDVVAENQKFWHNAAPTAYAVKKEMPATIAPGAYVDSLLKNQTVKETVGNEYIKRYSLTERPTYDTFSIYKILFLQCEPCLFPPLLI